MRASIYILGPLLGRFGEAKISFPGGCAFGPRPIDLHLEAMKSLGASIEIEEGYILARAKKGGRLNGGKFELKQISVGATGNMLMAAVLAKGGSLIKGAALEPEISTLINMLIKMGAKIKSTRKGGSAEIEVEGVHELVGVEETNTSDRIEAATLLAATAITGGKVSLTNVNIAELKAVIKNFKQAGCTMSVLPNLIRLESSNELFPVNVVAKPYPNFPTDMQAQWTALMTQSRGVSVIKDTVYLERFKHIPELNRLGAEITMNKNSAIVKGKKKLKGASVMSTDLRASACLVIAGLVASGKTEVLRAQGVLYPIKDGKKWGFMNGDGVFVVDYIYEDVGHFREGMARVKLEGCWGFIDHTGTEVIMPMYSMAYDFENGRALVSYGSGRTAVLINKDGNVVNNSLTKTDEFTEGLQRVEDGGRWGYRDQTGVMIIPYKYEWAGKFSDGLAPVKVFNTYGYIDKLGNIAIQPLFEYAGSFRNGLAPVTLGDRFGVINKSGSFVVSPQYDAISELVNGFFRIRQSKHWGYMNQLGYVKIPPQYNRVKDFENNLAPVFVGDDVIGKWGYVNHEGDLVIAPLFDDAKEFQDGVAEVTTKGLMGYINTNGTFLWLEVLSDEFVKP
ncbi:hypothetical protein CHS0354_024147 [Potamilus streckersoni]|uniref:UDP-N-acetylglucosamine 1-carboxyvinyltransferase n=1 Tax=Potamilus streckersoni TaxID=2493646 RepID=A0AAE0RZY2_9BIVA|nr:hypothetical protein CHS0354_024147 [Potamilus streckersoni]